MARFRAVYRRRRVGRRRRFRRRRTYRKRRRLSKGSFMCKLTKVSTYEVPNNATSTYSCSFLPSDFPEYKSLAPNFEYCKFIKQRVRVIPMQNVSNANTTIIPSYCILPWHKGGEAKKSFNQVISSDRAKIYRQTERGQMIFTCNTWTQSSPDDVTVRGMNTIIWKPTVPYDQTKFEPRIYSGLVVWQGEGNLEGRTSTFNVVEDVYCIFSNQTSLHVSPYPPTQSVEAMKI
ncbi:Cap protein [Cyclovirus PKgoat11/PAK/2009]|uniref:Cap protein n=1 Tax=Cyclovirus PKgoat11/PAK/2009 TaxID=942034 RepID=E9NWS7_9CIRC|nr:Cap protein [Cyclovirus PKgoat11/PAK/2009]ADU76998.1 Cap protein [Cyclovirus PKgoat11/PAK/2009]